ncbi:hypothetical protein D3C76_1038860 [compost metagenome]
MIGNESVLHDQRLCATPLHTSRVPIISDLVVAARQRSEAIKLFTCSIAAAEAHDRPLSMIAAATPSHFPTEQNPPLHLQGFAERCNAAARRCIGVLAPYLVLKLLGVHRQLVAMSTQKAESPSGTGTCPRQCDNTVRELRERNLHTTVAMRLEGPVHPNTLQESDIFCGDHSLPLRSLGVGRDGRKDRFEIFKKRVWCFHFGDP